jgi:bifunctional non-homologous end joining protein LigD
VPDLARTTWVKPKLVAEVKFTEWTAAGEMRHPVFLGLRTDKPATQVTREMPRPLREAKPKVQSKRR